MSVEKPILPDGIDSITIHPDPEGHVAYGWGEYEESSVLAGQSRRIWLGVYDTVEEARKAWPAATVDEWTASKPRASMPIAPPSWFDPADAGEAWGEDDY